MEEEKKRKLKHHEHRDRKKSPQTGSATNQ